MWYSLPPQIDARRWCIWTILIWASEESMTLQQLLQWADTWSVSFGLLLKPRHSKLLPACQAPTHHAQLSRLGKGLSIDADLPWEPICQLSWAEARNWRTQSTRQACAWNLFVCVAVALFLRGALLLLPWSCFLFMIVSFSCCLFFVSCFFAFLPHLCFLFLLFSLCSVLLDSCV